MLAEMTAEMMVNNLVETKAKKMVEKTALLLVVQRARK